LLQAATDLRDLIERFADDATLTQRTSYQAMVRVFAEHCEVGDAKVRLRKNGAASALQNPSDLDATYAGPKGTGYQLQIAETYGEQDVQLIVGALAQTAAEPDANALTPMLKQLQEHDRLPASVLADTVYGSDENVGLADALGTELVSPVPGRKGDTQGAEPTAATSPPLSIDDFAHDERTGTVTACPAGKIPLTVTYDAATQTTTITMPAADCQTCPFFAACPMRRTGQHYEMSYTDKHRRLDERRREQQTEPFQERYAKRAGLESTNSGLKRRLGLGQLRVRGLKAVAHALYLRVAGWNLFRATQATNLMAKVRALLAHRGLCTRLFACQSLWTCPRRTTQRWPDAPRPTFALRPT
jgi:hypothetical protein